MSRLWRWCLAAAALLAATSGVLSVSAADGIIQIKSASGLALPAQFTPAHLSPQPAASYAMTDKLMLPITGKTILASFHKHGLVSAYHGWIDGPITPGSQFVVYNSFAFSSNSSALQARISYQRLVIGTPIMYPGDQLPKSSLVWTYAGTDAKNRAYIAARIMFRVANVVCDVSGFYLGSDSTAANAALNETASVVAAYVHWLDRQLPAKHQIILPLIPLALLPLLRSHPGSK